MSLQTSQRAPLRTLTLDSIKFPSSEDPIKLWSKQSSSSSPSCVGTEFSSGPACHCRGSSSLFSPCPFLCGSQGGSSGLDYLVRMPASRRREWNKAMFSLLSACPIPIYILPARRRLGNVVPRPAIYVLHYRSCSMKMCYRCGGTISSTFPLPVTWGQ